MTPDTPTRYGTVSRLLHWAMAAGIGWMLLSAIVHAVANKSALDGLLWPAHKHVGSALFVLALLRATWALAHARRRPPAVSLPAQLGHLALYGLMLAIPSIGLLRQYGSARAFAPLGLPIFPGRDEADKIAWMTDLGSLLHGELGWVLLVAVLGHVGMVVWHRVRGEHDVLPRMTD